VLTLASTRLVAALAARLLHRRLFFHFFNQKELQVGDTSNPCVKQCTIEESEGSGLVIHDKATGTFLRNIILRSKLAGIGVRDNAEPILTANVIKVLECS
jgi:hypothetical protein